MAFKDIHKLKKIVEIQKEYIQTEHLVIGKDAFAISMYKFLVSKHGEEKVRLLTEDKIGLADLFIKGPSTVRGETNKAIIQKLYPNSIFEAVNSPTLFYKDLTWKAFGGRSKSEHLKHDEEYFVASRLNVNESDFFSWLSEEDYLLDQINEKAYQVKIKNLHYKEDCFLVECINGTEFKTTQLYFSKSPAYFLNKFQEKNILSDKLIQFCESTKTVQGLFIKYIFEKRVTDLVETLFIPLSYTHDWGHFVGEFRSNGDGQIADFFHYIDEDHTSEEDISRTIRQLKKSFEKIFENFSKIKYQEFISLEDDMGCLKIDDELFNQCLKLDEKILGQLKFIGRSAPIVNDQCVEDSFEYSPKSVNQLTRALLVEQNFLRRS